MNYVAIALLQLGLASYGGGMPFGGAPMAGGFGMGGGFPTGGFSGGKFASHGVTQRRCGHIHL